MAKHTLDFENRKYCLKVNNGTQCVGKMYGYNFSFFSTIFFSKGNNFCDFLFASLDDKIPTKQGLLLKEQVLFSSLGRSPGRAIVLPPASSLAKSLTLKYFM